MNKEEIRKTAEGNIDNSNNEAKSDFAKMQFVQAYERILAKVPFDQQYKKIKILWKYIVETIEHERQELTIHHSEICKVDEKQQKSFEVINNNCVEIIRVYRMLCMLFKDYTNNIIETRERAMWLACEKQKLSASTATFDAQVQKCNQIHQRILGSFGRRNARLNFITKKDELLSFKEGIEASSDKYQNNEGASANPTKSDERGREPSSSINDSTCKKTTELFFSEEYNTTPLQNDLDGRNIPTKKRKCPAECEWFDIVQQIRGEIAKNKIEILEHHLRI